MTSFGQSEHRGLSAYLPPFLRDIRVIQVIGQILFVIVVLAVISQVVAIASGEFAARGLTPNFGFLQNRAGFNLDESPAWYSSDSSYRDAFVVGVINTLRVVSIGLVSATVLGVTLGVLLLSSNWLIHTISRAYVELLRNTPLLVQLYVWYYIVMLSFPEPRAGFLTVPQEGILFITNRLFIYILCYALLWFFYIRHYTPGSHLRRGVVTAFLAVTVVLEVAFYLFNTSPAWAGLYGNGQIGSLGFLVYLAVSFAVIFAGFFRGGHFRGLIMGIGIGQLIAGLLFYFGIIPDTSMQVELQPAFFFSNRSFAFPEFLPTNRFNEWMAFVGLGFLLATVIWVTAGNITERTGRAIPRALYAFIAVVVVSIVGWWLVGIEPVPSTVTLNVDGAAQVLTLDDAVKQGLISPADMRLYSQEPVHVILPTTNNFGRFQTGSEISPEFMAVLLGLVIYTSAFIGEIVRAGIQAVPTGQVEAARAIGLSQFNILTLIVLPQALRVIIPPMGNQFLNLAKNSSLAIAIGFADIFQVASTIMNQSGQSIPVMLMVMIAYLIMSLLISATMNWVNGRFQLITR
jgi:His/Glu/Gln/Arg/opine family amino acid ABC transporter permease subunit